MNVVRSSQDGESSLPIRAQAATWLAALRGPNRTPELVNRFEKWLAEDERHRAIWEQMTDSWDLAGGLQMDIRSLSAAAEREEARRTRFISAMAASFLVAVLVASGAFYYAFRSIRFTTAVGEQRIVTLTDGTRVALNTNTRILIHYGKAFRRITLERGEALFDVAQRSRSPFIVAAGGREIEALGTSFIVREDDQHGLAVTLVEGKVAVSSEKDARVAEAPQILQPGERLTLSARAPAILDRPQIRQLTAWQRGEVAFDETPLIQAIAEMNRYSTVSIRVRGGLPPGHRLSGRFRAGDSAEFARGIAKTYGLTLTETDHELLLDTGSGRQR